MTVDLLRLVMEKEKERERERASAVARSFLCLRALARLNLRDPDTLRAALLDVVREIPTTPQDGEGSRICLMGTHQFLGILQEVFHIVPFALPTIGG